MMEALFHFLKKNIPDVEKIISCERLSGGASQETYRLVVKAQNQEWVWAFRRAAGGAGKRRAPSILGPSPGLALEARLMRIAHDHGVPEPHLVAVLSEEDNLGEGFIMEWLDGETLGKRVLTSPALAGIRPKLAFQCGEILARIHAIDVKKTGLAPHLMQQTARQALAQVYEAYQSFKTPRPMIDYAASWLEDHLPQDENMVLIHNDFRNGNLIIAPEGIAAVLDWELACISDPMRDLGWICANCWRFGHSALPVGGFGAYDDLFRGYESVSGQKIDRRRVKFWEAFASFRWAVICLGMAAQWRSGADKSVERAAIGRRASEGEMDCVNLLIAGDIDDFEIKKDMEGLEELDMPNQIELLEAVREHLRSEKSAAQKTRAGFLALVAANVMDIVLRQFIMGPQHQKLEMKDLEMILREKNNLSQNNLSQNNLSQNNLSQLRWTLIEKMRKKKIPLSDKKLTSYLRQQTARQVMIDQPNYSGLKAACAKESR